MRSGRSLSLVVACRRRPRRGRRRWLGAKADRARRRRNEHRRPADDARCRARWPQRACRRRREARCSATASIPARIYAARSAGSSRIYAFFDGADRARRPGLRLRRLRERLHPHELARDHRTPASRPDERGDEGLRRVQGRRPGPGQDRRLGRLRRRRRCSSRSRRPRARAGSARRLVAGRRRRAGRRDRQPVRERGLARGRRRLGHGALDLLADLRATRVVDAIQTDAPINHGNSGGPLFERAAA